MSQLKTASKIAILFLIPVLFLYGLILTSSPVFSNEVEQIESEIDQKKEELNKQKGVLSSIEKRIAEISSSNLSLSEKINEINKEITKIEDQIESKEKDIEQKLKEISEKQDMLNSKKELLDNVSSQLYMQTRYDGAQFIFSVNNFDLMLKNIFVKSSAISVLRNDIEHISGEFSSLADMKAELENEKVELDTQKKDLNDSYGLLATEKAKLQKELNTQIATKGFVTRKINGLSAELSDLQYQLIIARQGGTSVNPDSVPSGGDKYGSLSGFRTTAPSGSFGIFSIGAYTHRNGISQWGAKARAEAGQKYNQILSAYYPGKKLRTGTVVINGTSRSIMTNIKTTTYGTLNFENDYMLRLGEVPESWPMEILKAQAIAARTYAINYTGNGSKTICTTESCQVIGASKKTGRWKTAVEATRGVILTDSSGRVFSTQYAAVHGGWINGVGWDTTDGKGTGDWMGRAWDSKSGVSWFYKSWYRSGYVSGDKVDSSSCYRYPWLSQAEMADIVNAYQVWRANDRSDSRIYPIPDACHSGGNPYTHAELRSLAAKPVSSISLVVTSSSNGYTNSITFYTNAGTITMSGNDFKTIYNLRAPGYLRIPQSGFVHINIEKK